MGNCSPEVYADLVHGAVWPMVRPVWEELYWCTSISHRRLLLQCACCIIKEPCWTHSSVSDFFSSEVIAVEVCQDSGSTMTLGYVFYFP